MKHFLTFFSEFLSREGPPKGPFVRLNPPVGVTPAPLPPMRGEIGFSGDAELTRFARSGLRRKEGGKFHVIVRNSSSILNISFEKTQLCQKNLRASKNGSGAAVVRSKYSKNISFTPKRSTLLQGGEVKSQGEQRRRSH